MGERGCGVLERDLRGRFIIDEFEFQRIVAIIPAKSIFEEI